MKCQIEVKTKDEFRDTHGEHVRHSVSDLGIKHIPKVKYIQLYLIEGDFNLRDLNNIAKNILIDPIMQNCTIKVLDLNNHEKTKNNSEHHEGCEVEVWFKTGVTDVVAESVIKAIKDLDIKNNLSVKTGCKYLFAGKITSGLVKQITDKLLVNSLIQKYSIAGV